MKKFNVILSLSLLVMVAVVSSCNDDEPQSKTDLLTSKGWSFSAASLKFTNGTEVDASNDFINNCEKDDVLTFSKDGAFKNEVGADNCGGDSSTSTGAWAWKENETILTITTNDDTEELKLISLTGNTLKLNLGTMEYDTNGDGIEDSDVTVIYTLTAK